MMITSKRGLLKKLQENKNSLEFKTIKNIYGKNIGEIRQVGKHVQTNAFTLLSKRDEGIVDSWIYVYDKDVEVKNNHIYYYEYKKEHTKDNIIIDIEIIEK